MEQWKSPRRIQEEADLAHKERDDAHRALRMKVGTALADCVLDGLMQPSEAKTVYGNQFPEVNRL